MKKVLIVIQDMESGGAQKSLLTFLNCLVKKTNQYNIDVMVVKPKGIFYSQIPNGVNVISAPRELLWLGTSLDDSLIKRNPSFRGLMGKLLWISRKKLKLFPESLNDEQKLWICWKKLIPINKQKYDIAISYMNGFPNYYIIDKVISDKKVLWIHNEYQKIGYDVDFDRCYYKMCNNIITISKKCLESFTEVFPNLEEKITILENITVREDIIEQGNTGVALEFVCNNSLKLLSIGRLTEQKGFDYAVAAAKILKKNGVDFIWLILGDGPEREALQLQIDKNGLTENIKMIGIRNNPYVYIKACNIFVQTSRFEGKSIVLDEAKIFCKPIVVTSYPTVYDSITDGVNGMIVKMDAEAIADGIQRLSRDEQVRELFCKELKRIKDNNEQELNKYINVMLE